MKKTFKLKDSSEKMKKFDQLMDRAVELGISLSCGEGPMFVQFDGDDQLYEINDIEDARGICEFPPAFEFKVTFSKEV
jgi:hypothetical protein